MMTHPRLRLGVAVALFLGWIAYLAYLVARTRDPVILSRPQLLHAEVVIVAQVEEKNGVPNPVVTVKEVLWAENGKVAPAVGTMLHLPEVIDVTRSQGWRGPNEYLIPLTLTQKNTEVSYHVTSLPWSPGFAPLFQVEVARGPKVKEAIKTWAEKNAPHDVARLAEELSKGDQKDVFVLKRNLELQEAEKVQSELQALEIPSQRPWGEYRIYLATQDAREQLRSLKHQ